MVGGTNSHVRLVAGIFHLPRAVPSGRAGAIPVAFASGIVLGGVRVGIGQRRRSAKRRRFFNGEKNAWPTTNPRFSILSTFPARATRMGGAGGVGRGAVGRAPAVGHLMGVENGVGARGPDGREESLVFLFPIQAWHCISRRGIGH